MHQILNLGIFLPLVRILELILAAVLCSNHQASNSVRDPPRDRCGLDALVLSLCRIRTWREKTRRRLRVVPTMVLFLAGGQSRLMFWQEQLDLLRLLT
jgi:hypothetical protein